MNFKKVTATQQQIDKFKLKKGDVIIVQGGGITSIGNPALVIEDMEDVVFGPHLIMIKLYDLDFSTYLPTVIQSKPIKDHFIAELQAVSLFNINHKTIGNAPICIPPKEQQEIIIDLIRMNRIRVDSLIEKINKTIKLIKERRIAFHSHAVTGQIDLRE